MAQIGDKFDQINLVDDVCEMGFEKELSVKEKAEFLRNQLYYVYIQRSHKLRSRN